MGGTNRVCLTFMVVKKWLTKETLESVEWLPADEGLIEKIREYIQKN